MHFPSLSIKYLHIVLANRAQLFSVRRTKPVKHQRDPSNVVVGRAFCTPTYVHACVRVRGCANGSGDGVCVRVCVGGGG